MGEPDNNLVNYVYTYLQQGYEINTIKESLLKEGFTKKQIDVATDFVYANYYYQNKANPVKPNITNYKAQKSNKHIGVTEIAVLILIIFGISLVGMSLVFILSTPDETSIIGNTPNIKDSLENTIPEKESEVVQDTIIETENDNKIVIEESDTKIIPKVETITKPSAVEESISENFDSSKTYSQRQLEVKVNHFAENNPTEAIKFCDEMITTVSKEYCYLDVASESGIEVYCDEITSSLIKDDCYRELVFEEKGDGQTCDKVNDDYKRKGCHDFLKILQTKEELTLRLEEGDNNLLNETTLYPDYVEANFNEVN